MKIPPEAKLVFKGKIFDVYQWEQKMFDGSWATFEMLKRPNTVEVIATDKDKILLSRQSQPNKLDFYSLFGGRGEENEDPLSTAKRELKEEAGLESEDWELLRTYEPMHKIDWQIYMFVARNCKRVTDPKLDVGEKIETIKWSFDRFVQIVESDKYWGNELALDILKMKQNERKWQEFKEKIFPSYAKI